MSTTPEVPTSEIGDVGAETYCYAHPKEPTKLRCSRCDRPICGRCAIPASVGQHCPECVAEARRSTPKVRSALRATAPVVFTILIVNLVLWVVQAFVWPEITPRFAAHAPSIAAGEWYRLITPMFLHAPHSFWHIGFNSYALFAFGPHVEQAFGKARFLVLYLVAGFTGSALSYAFGGNCQAIGVGASGAIFGVLGGLLVFLYNRRRSQFVRAFMKNIIFLIAINLVFGYVIPGIDNMAHLGGLMGGAGVAAGLDRAPGHEPSPVAQVAMTLLIVISAIALVAWKTANFTC